MSALQVALNLRPTLSNCSQEAELSDEAITLEAVPRKFGKTRGSHLAVWFLEGPASYLPLPTFILCLSPMLAGGKAAEA